MFEGTLAKRTSVFEGTLAKRTSVFEGTLFVEKLCIVYFNLDELFGSQALH